MFLSRPDLIALTGYKVSSRQVEVLRSLGIPFALVRGEVKVLADHVRAAIEGRPVRQVREPNMEAVR